MESPGTITREKLSQLTGIPVARLRQLAADGFFSKASNGSYKLTEAIQGLFRYYRETSQELPVFDSIEACVGSTGIPKDTIKEAKRAGSDAFRSNRVDLKRLLSWLFSENGKDSSGGTYEYFKMRKIEEEAKLLTLDRLEREKVLVNLNDVLRLVEAPWVVVRQRMLALPAEAAAKCNPGDPDLAREALDGWLNYSLASIRDQLPKSPVVEPKPQPAEQPEGEA